MMSARNVRLPGSPLVHGCNDRDAPTYCRKPSGNGAQTTDRITCPKCLERMKVQAEGSQATIVALKKWADPDRKR